MVTSLENLVLADSDCEDGLIAGAALFCLYARARVGDIAKCSEEPSLDIAQDGSLGFIQSRLLDHKTARPGEKRSLPVVAPVFGVTGRNWATHWMRGRCAARLDAHISGTLLQAPAMDGTWAAAPMTTVEFGIALREVLKKAGFSADELGNIGAHSLKSTALSWLARAGIDRDTRRVLGYHIRKDERSMEAYSRDSLAGPLRTLSSVIANIACGRCAPDSTRSGQFVGAASNPEAKTCTPASSTCSSRSSSPATSLASSEPGTVADAPEGPELDSDKSLRHEFGNEVRAHRGSHRRSPLWKPLPLKHSFLEDLPDKCRTCAKCF